MSELVQKLNWGIWPPVQKVIAWGARAIFESDGRGGLQASLVWDRQDMQGGTEEQRQQLADFINRWGMPAVQKLIKEEALYSNEDRLVTAQLHGWCICMNPRSSYGYLYIGVFPIDNGDPNFFPPQHPDPPKGRVEDARGSGPTRKARNNGRSSYR